MYWRLCRRKISNHFSNSASFFVSMENHTPLFSPRQIGGMGDGALKLEIARRGRCFETWKVVKKWGYTLTGMRPMVGLLYIITTDVWGALACLLQTGK
jgi:hypothetical protein